MAPEVSPLHAVVLAAGAGTRFGGGKQLALWRGRPLVLAAVESALAAPVERVLVVLGFEAGAVRRALQPLAGPRLETVIAQDWDEGMAASLRAGVRALPPGSAGCLVFLGDMPSIPADLPQRVADELTRGAATVQPWRAGQPAHPVGFSKGLYADLLALTGDQGAGALLRARDDVVRLEIDDPGAVFDIDRPDDLNG